MKVLPVVFLFCAAVRGFAAETAPPNFVVILGEAQGWASSSVQMDEAVPGSKSTLAQTPNLEALARGGMRFANFYAASPRCMPTRAALFTGRSPAALHMTYIGEGKRDEMPDSGRKLLPPHCSLEMPEAEITIAEILKSGGYATAHFGKWHAGRVDPRRHGFDESDGATSNVGPGGDQNPNPKQAFSMTERGVDFMARQVKAGKPFYLQISHYAGDGGTAARPETYAAVRRRARAGDEKQVENVAMTEDMDETIGTLLAKLESLGIGHRTYVFYTADHGSKGHVTNGILAGGKGTVLEGGLRVPLIVSGPGVKAGACAHVRASTVDILPTVVALAGIRDPLPEGVEGGNLAGVLAGEAAPVKRPREDFVVHFPHYDKDDTGPASVLYSGAEKLVRVYESAELRLFNVENDRSERRNLAKENPARIAELERRLDAYLEVVHAQMPAPNPAYDPTSPTAPSQQQGRRKKERDGGR
jgi:arylsulfatase A-like enzyme